MSKRGGGTVGGAQYGILVVEGNQIYTINPCQLNLVYMFRMFLPYACHLVKARD